MRGRVAIWSCWAVRPRCRRASRTIAFGTGVTEALDDLNQGQIGIGGAAPDEKHRAVFPQNAIKMVSRRSANHELRAAAMLMGCISRSEQTVAASPRREVTRLRSLNASTIAATAHSDTQGT